MNVTHLVTEEPRYFLDRSKAFAIIDSHGGKLWQRKSGAPSSIKPWATGELPVSRLDWYSLHSINGAKPE